MKCQENKTDAGSLRENDKQTINAMRQREEKRIAGIRFKFPKMYS
jgi:hypothetical protein